MSWEFGIRKKFIWNSDPGVKQAPNPGSATQLTSLGAEHIDTRLNMFSSDFVVGFSTYSTVP
jgi:hypothetical protein